MVFLNLFDDKKFAVMLAPGLFKILSKQFLNTYSFPDVHHLVHGDKEDPADRGNVERGITYKVLWVHTKWSKYNDSTGYYRGDEDTGA